MRIGKLSMFILVLILSAFFVGRVSAPSSPTVPRTGTGGPIGPCTWFVSMDGTTPVAEAMVAGLSVNPGDNVVGTAGQDPAAFIVNIETAGQAICLSAQVFLVQSPISFNVNNIVIRGSGWSTIIRASASFTRTGTYGPISGIIENLQQSTAGVQNITISDLAIDGNKAARAFLADDEGIRFDGALSSLNRNIKIDNVYIHDVYGSCINFRYVDGYTITRSLVEKCSIAAQGGIYHGIYTLRSINGQITDDLARSMPDGSGFKIGLGDINTELSNDNSLLNAKDGYEFSGGSVVADQVRNIALSSDVASNNTLNGYDLNVVLGNHVIIWTGLVAVFNVQNGMLLNNISNMTITSCIVMDNAFGVTGWQGIRVFSSTHIVVSGCRIGDDQSVKSQAYGVLVSGSSNVVVTDNDLSGNLGLPFLDNGGNLNSTIFLRNNAGLNPAGRTGNYATSVGASRYIEFQGGTQSTVVASTDYVIGQMDCFLTSTGGTGVSITIKDPSGTAVASGLTTLSAQWLVVGYKINFGGFSGAPTVNVFFN